MVPPFFNHMATGYGSLAPGKKQVARSQQPKFQNHTPENCWILKPGISFLSPVSHLPQCNISLSYAVVILHNQLILFIIKTIKI